MTEPQIDVVTTPPPDEGPKPPRLADAVRRQPWLVAGIAVLLVGAGYLIGTVRGGVMTHTGLAYAAETQIGVTADNWSYDIPLTVLWSDAGGGLHFGERPACLPPSTQQVSVRFGEVEVSVNGTSYRQVVWVSCPGVVP